MIQENYIYGALYFYYYYISFTSDHQALHPGGWGPLLYCVARKQKQTVYVLMLLQAPLKVLGFHRWPSLVPSAGSLPAPSGSLTHCTCHLLLVPGYSMFIWFAHILPVIVYSRRLLLLQNSGQASLLWGSPADCSSQGQGSLFWVAVTLGQTHEILGCVV